MILTFMDRGWLAKSERKEEEEIIILRTGLGGECGGNVAGGKTKDPNL